MINVLDELITKFGRNKVEGKPGDKRAKVVCPFHNSGQEKTASLVVNLTNPRIGYSWCFACNWRGGLNKLLGENILEYEETLSVDLDDSILNEDVSQVNSDWKQWPRWPRDKTWRTIPGWLVRKVGGRIEETEYGLRLALPVIQHKKCQGLIHCAFKKTKLAYIYDSHPFINTSFYLYDYAQKKLALSRTKTLMIVEGPRDALNIAKADIPVIGNLGGITVFTPEKAELILQLNPNQLLIATDPDEIGNRLAEAIADACPGIKKKRIKFKIVRDAKGKVLQKEDPGSMGELRLAKLAKLYT